MKALNPDWQWMKILLRLVFVALVSSLFWECSHFHAGVSPSNVPVSRKDYSRLGSVTKEKKWIQLDIGINVLPKEGGPKMRDLIQAALIEKEADAIIDIRYWNDEIRLGPFRIVRIGFSGEAIQLGKK